MKLTLEEKQERVEKLRPIDDVFFEVLADNVEVMEEILQTILEDDGLIVQDVTVQSSKRNLYGRSVRLDAYCELSTGVKVNVEVQRSDKDNHIKRVRFNASVITTKESNPGEHYDDILELYVVYISEFDIFHKGKTIYHVENVIWETGDAVDDGLHRIFANAEVDDGSRIASLMSCFTKKMVNNPDFPKLSERVAELKTTERGQDAVCDVMEYYEEKAKAEGERIGLAKGEKIGLTKGEKIGLVKGENRLASLNNKLMSQKRYEDVTRANSDSEYRKKLYAEFGIV